MNFYFQFSIAWLSCLCFQTYACIHARFKFLIRNTRTTILFGIIQWFWLHSKEQCQSDTKCYPCFLFYLEGLHAGPENIFQSSLSVTIRFPWIIAPSSPKLSTSICWKLTLRMVREKIFAQILWSSNLWVLFRSVFWFWHKATSVRHFSTCGVLSPRRCGGSNWWSTLSKGGSSLLGRLMGYFDINWAVICNLKNKMKQLITNTDKFVSSKLYEQFLIVISHLHFSSEQICLLSKVKDSVFLMVLLVNLLV